MGSLFDKLIGIFKRHHIPLTPVLSGTILTIDDDLNQRTLIQKTLEKRGLSVLIAEKGEKGLEMAMTHKPNLILVDVVMPGLNGKEVCKRLKSDSRTRDIPILFLTAQDAPNDIVEHYELGAEIHLTKPINPKELLLQVETTLKES